MNEDLPTFAVMNAERSHPKAGVQAISARLWSSRVFFRRNTRASACATGADPVLYVKNPDGVSTDVRRKMLDGLNELNRMQHEKIGDPENAGPASNSMRWLFRMQASVPEMSDLSSEPESTFKRWGEEAKETRQVPKRRSDGPAD